MDQNMARMNHVFGYINRDVLIMRRNQSDEQSDAHDPLLREMRLPYSARGVESQ